MSQRLCLIVACTLLGACSSGGAKVSVSKEPPGPNCPNGGQRIDVVQDGKTTTSYVCNGADGATVSVSTTELPPGDPHCPTGGVAIQVGDNQPQYLCDGPATTWTVIDSDTQAEPGHGYLAKLGAVGRITLTLPASSSLKVGDEIRVANLAQSGMDVLVDGTSTDNGIPSSSLSAVALPWGDWSDVACSPDGQHVVATQTVDDYRGSTAPGIYVSDDFGQTWTKTSAPKGSWASVAESSDGRTIVASTYTEVFLSSDGGETWGVASGVPPGKWSAVAVSNDGTHLAAAGSDHGIYASSDGGKSWVNTKAPAGKWSALAVSPDGLTMLAGDDAGLYRSDDGGTTWVNTKPLAVAPTGLAMSQDGSVVYATAKGPTLFLSEDGGATWGKFQLDTATIHDNSLASVCVNSGPFAADEAVVATSNGTVFEYAPWVSPAYQLHPHGAIPYAVDGVRIACSADISRLYVAFPTGTVRADVPLGSLSVEAGSSLDLVNTGHSFVVVGKTGEVLGY